MAEDSEGYQATAEDWDDYGRYLDENPMTDEEIEIMLTKTYEEEMSLKDTIKDSLSQIPAELQKTAQSAFADVGNTYQNFLYKDTSFGVFHHSGAGLTHEIATQEAGREAEQFTPEPSPEIEPDR